jgi:putative transposase
MFEQDQFLHWLRKLNLSERTERLIQHIRSSNPARLVQSGHGNVSGRYPSRKMGVTIQFESHKNELAHILELEHASDVIEFYDQPPSIKLEYQSAAGKKLGVIHTPDFFVIRETSAGWEECKMEEELNRLAVKSPNRYCRDETGRWICPPGESYAAQFGLYYQVASSAGINWVWQRNIIWRRRRLAAVISDYCHDRTLETEKTNYRRRPGLCLMNSSKMITKPLSRKSV